MIVPIKSGAQTSRMFAFSAGLFIWWRSWTGLAGYVLSWLLSTTMDAEFCVETLEDALTVAKPEIFNSDQGSQFTSHAFTGVPESPPGANQHGWSRSRLG